MTISNQHIQQIMIALGFSQETALTFLIAAGDNFTSVVDTNGDVHAWGNNGFVGANPLSAVNPWVDTSNVIITL